MAAGGNAHPHPPASQPPTRRSTMRYLLPLLAALAMPAQADSEARMGADFVRITALPCKSEAVVAAIQKLGLDPLDFRAARAEFGGKPYAACWRQQGGIAHVVYEDG